MAMTSQGLDYFPFSTDFFDDDKIALIEAEFGEKGSYIALRLLCRIYRIEGYYCKWGKDECLLFAKKLGGKFSAGLVQEVVSGLVARSFFDKGVYDSFGVLTSHGIQNRFLEATKRRQEVRLCREFLLVDVSKNKNVCIFSKNVDISTENADIFEQSKVKESKVKERNYSSSFYELSSLEQKEEKELFYEIFFFKNYGSLYDEVERFIASNTATGWKKSNGQEYDSREKRVALAGTWRQKPVQEPRIKVAGFLPIWRKIYGHCKLDNPKLASAFLYHKTDCRLGTAQHADELQVFCAGPVSDWIAADQERANTVIGMFERLAKTCGRKTVKIYKI